MRDKPTGYVFTEGGKVLHETMAPTLGACMYRAGVFVLAYDRSELLALLRGAYRRGGRVMRLYGHV